MKCPNCRSVITAGQQFCRVCGTELLETANVQRPLNPVIWGLLAAFAGIAIALTGKMLDQSSVVYAGVIVSISGMFFIAAYPLLGPRRTGILQVSSKSEPLIAAEPTNKLPPMSAMDQIQSVTDDTTILLKAPEPRTQGRG